MRKYLRYLSRICVPQVLLVGLILLIPFPPRWSNYLMILLGAILIIRFRESRTTYSPPLPVYLLIATYLIRIIWLVSTDDLRYGLRTLETEIPLLAIPLFFFFFKPSPNDRRRLLDSFITMAFLMMLFSFATLFSFIASSEHTIWNYWSTHFVTAQYYSMLNMFSWSYAHYSFLSLIVIYGLNLVVFREKSTGLGYRLFALIYALVGGLFIIVGGSVAGLVIMIGCYCVYLLVVLYRRWGLQPVTAVIVLTIIFALVFISGRNLKDELFKADPQRYQLFNVSFRLWKERPLFGYGTGAQKGLMQNVDHARELGFAVENYPGPLVNHPHNQFLTDLLQFGLIGTIPLILFVVSCTAHSIKTNNWPLLLTIFTVTLSMTIESPINSNKGLVPFVLLVCILSSRSLESKDGKTP